MTEPAAPHAAPEDLTQRCEQLARELAQARAELHDFTYSVSHDLRASLRHVTAFSQLAQEELAEQSGHPALGHLSRVTQAARQMGRQIDGLMELSRLSAVALQWSAVDVGDIVKPLCADLAQAAAGRSLAWRLADAWPVVRADAALLRQALGHVLSNAIKFSAGRSPAEIAVQWQPAAPGQCTLMVSDNGVGFNPQYRAKLFQAFQRLHSPREFEGLGMGLAQVRTIAERLGGAVDAEGQVNGGCRVSLTLALA
jgi:light-regulated signal transduction histidine kinase (bacteriophytochrome)